MNIETLVTIEYHGILFFFQFPKFILVDYYFFRKYKNNFFLLVFNQLVICLGESFA